MSAASQDLRDLRDRIPSDHGLTVFDAETQDTSYGTLVVDDVPLIFDTHRKDGKYVATAEILTEVVNPLRISRARVRDLERDAARRGLLAIPYSSCFFKGNLHVYAFAGVVRGFDVAAVGGSVEDAEAALRARVEGLWDRIPREILRAQRDLLAGRRRARYDADLEVLRTRYRAVEGRSP